MLTDADNPARRTRSLFWRIMILGIGPRLFAAQHAAEHSPTTGIALPLPLFRANSVGTTRIRQRCMDSAGVAGGSSVRVSSGAFEVI
jgi:hypothetical protein